MTDVVQAVIERADAHPDRLAILSARGRSVTYGDLATGVRAVATHLVDSGVGPGDGVLLAVRPSARAVMAALGTVLAGAVVVVADPGAGAALVAVRREIVPVRAAVADTIVHAATRAPLSWLLARVPATAGLQLPDLSEHGLVHVVTGPRLPGVPRGATRWTSLPARVARAEEVAEPTPASSPTPIDRDALVVFTSGSTAAPRAVVHSVASLSAGVSAAVGALELDEHVVMHTDQLMIGLPTLVAGGSWSLPPVTASPAAWVRQAETVGATYAYAVPTKLLAAALIGLPPSVRRLGTGGAPVLPATVERLAELAPGVGLRAVYGLTEALPVAVATGEQVLASPPGRTALGRPLPGVTVSVMGALEGADHDGVGELVVTGPQTRDRLSGEPPSPEVHTGDLGGIAADGMLLLAGRAKNMIIRGQANIYPELVEPLLRERHSLTLSDCALVGSRDPLSGDERVVLAVVPSDQGRRAPSPARLARLVHDAWSAVADEAWRPDAVVAVARIPRRGRSDAVDLDALRLLVSAAGGAGVTGPVSRTVTTPPVRRGRRP